MAKAPKKKSESTAVTNWQAELEAQAQVAAEMEKNTAGGQFFSFRNGILSFDDAPLPGNQAVIIILDSILEYTYYEGAYDPDDPQAPTAYAFGRDEDTIRWSEDSSPEYAGELCKDSDINQWGSAETGRGKACKNSRRLAVIPAGTYNKKGDLEIFDDIDHFEKAQIAFMKLPVTSVKGYSTFVKQLAAVLKRPPHGVIARVSVVPDPKTQFRVLFEVIDKAPDEIMPTIMQRHEEAMAVIEFPYNMEDREDERPAKAKGGKKTAAKKTKRKY